MLGILLLVASVVTATFVSSYAVMFPWWRSGLGRSLFVAFGSLVVMFGAEAGSRLAGWPSEVVSGLGLVGVLGYTGGLGGLGWALVRAWLAPPGSSE